MSAEQEIPSVPETQHTGRMEFKICSIINEHPRISIGISAMSFPCENASLNSSSVYILRLSSIGFRD